MGLAKRARWPIVALVGLMLIALVASCNLRTGVDRSSSTEERSDGVSAEFETLFEIYLALKKDHVNRAYLEDVVLNEGAIRGMLKALDDPHASYLSPDLFNLEIDRFKGSFEGIGAEVSLRDGEFIIVAPLPNTPADKAGVLPGDVILEIDGESTQGMGLFEVVSKIRGAKGTPVELMITHLKSGETVVVTITRGVINMPTVELRMLSGGLGHLKITTFGETTDAELREALDKADRFKVQGLVLDLRNNPGGLVSATIDVTSHFLESGLILYQIDGHGRRSDMKVKPGGRARTIPLVVLVNEFSASSSEIMAGAIRDHNRAPILGSRTFGKGSVSVQLPLRDGSGVYYTVARWYTPGGALIEGVGIEPDIEILPDPDGVEDLQLDRAIETLQNLILQGG